MHSFLYTATNSNDNDSESDKDAAAIFKSPEIKTIDLWGRDKYELATHTVKVKRSGMLADVRTLWDLQGKLT